MYFSNLRIIFLGSLAIFTGIVIVLVLFFDKLSFVANAANSGGMGIQIDTNEAHKIPSSEHVQALGASWVRFVWRQGVGMPNVPDGVKLLVVVNNESAPVAPIGIDDLQTWKNYTDASFVPQLNTLLDTTPNISAIEVWNEEDICPGDSYCPGVPSHAYGYLLQQAATTIKSRNPSIQVIAGGLASGDPSYLIKVRDAHPSAFNQVDAIGVHPYGKSPDGWCGGSNL